ncbi:Ras GTPase [Pelomyxa schiedti]|nr:Ras GTPase [Pelomyxa schiedti]
MAVQEYKVVVEGERGVGKSALIVAFSVGAFVGEWAPSNEDTYRQGVCIDEEPACVLDILDIGPNTEPSSLYKQYMAEANGFVIVYAIDSRSSFENIPAIRDKCLTQKNPTFPMVLCGNKSDLTQRQVSLTEGTTLANSYGIPFMETSCKEQVNVREVFHQLVRQMRPQAPNRTSPPKCCIC